MKWEYKTMAFDRMDHPEINKLGAEGWEAFAAFQTFMTVVANTKRELIVLLFKRQLPEPPLA